MIFMRTVGTDQVRLCQVKTYMSHTDLAVTSLGMAVDPQICPNTKLKAVNEIHSFMMTSMTH